MRPISAERTCPGCGSTGPARSTKGSLDPEDAVIAVDRGTRRGSHVFKALCLGAKPVLAGRPSGSCRTVWNAFKRLSSSPSAEEGAALLTGTARRVCHLPDAP
ncbi:alpha-hydroxy-acid oxidizing protein [Roseomonas chloroacetimidivorans]|uniref:alpha-hydroxy-acid oxidizing protein n=1 Tax=Roseomonas chloroacetimidivorans TaxID=1766656 RepID=UPI003C756191